MLEGTRNQPTWAPLVVLSAGMMLTVLDTTLLNLALPSIGRSYSARSAELAWVVVGYVLTFAAFMLIGGSLGDRLGRRPVFLLGIVAFGACSIGATLATSVAWLAAARALMGIAAALVFPTALGLLRDVYVDPQRRAVAVGFWSASQGIALIIGPLVGGWLTQSLGWKAVFWLNVPICAATAVAVPAYLPPPVSRPGVRLDAIGAVLSGCGLGSLVFAILRAGDVGWSDGGTLGWFISAALVISTLGVWEARHPEPMLDLSLLRDRRFVGVCLAISLLFFGLYGFLFIGTQYLQDGLSHSPAETGLLTAPFALTLVPTAAIAGYALRRLSYRVVIVGGLTVMAIALAASTRLGVAPSPFAIVGVIGLLGVGFALCSVAGTAATLAIVGAERAGIGSAMNEAAQQVGGTIGVAVVGSVAAGAYGASLQFGTFPLDLHQSAVAHDSLRAALDVAVTLAPSAAAKMRAAAIDAFVQSFRSSGYVSAAALLAGAAVAALLMRSDRAASQPRDGEATQR